MVRDGEEQMEEHEELSTLERLSIFYAIVYISFIFSKSFHEVVSWFY